MPFGNRGEDSCRPFCCAIQVAPGPQIHRVRIHGLVHWRKSGFGHVYKIHRTHHIVAFGQRVSSRKDACPGPLSHFWSPAQLVQAQAAQHRHAGNAGPEGHLDPG